MVQDVKDLGANCYVEFSEIRLMWLFLKMEKSKLVMPGPVKIFGLHCHGG